jgi:murein L,D-transpeptidase YcbB/YkuD
VLAWMLAAPPLYRPELPGLRHETAMELRGLMASSMHADLRWPEFSAYRTQVTNFYSSLGYALAWTEDGLPTAAARVVIEALIASASNGLDPEDYDGPRWSLRLLELQKHGASPRDLARFDLSLTISTMRYVSDLCAGKVNPRLLHPDFRLTHDNPDPASFVRERLLPADNPGLVLKSLEPQFDGYRRTKDALRLYRELAGRSTNQPLPRLPRPLEAGDSYSGIKRLTELLQLVGDLRGGDAVVPAQMDVYQSSLVEAVKKFQVRHGLSPDGRIDAGTLRELDIPLRRRVRQLQLTLERWRWVPHTFPRPPIVVNIPEFRLRALSDSYLTELDMKVVVGKAYRHRTPVFAAELTHVIFRPYWNVPLSIVRGEVLPVLERTGLTAAYRDFQIVTPDGTVVTNHRVSDRTISLLRSGKLLIRQLPGPKNALGLVKFIFPNDNNVYLHDTPTQHLFSKVRRDFSHGCIRVEKPKALAEWVFRNNSEWSPQRIAAAMNGTGTIQANVDPVIPVLIVYATAVALQGGEVRFFADIYGHDASLEVQLAQPHP